MRDIELIRDVVVSGGGRAMLEDAADIMRLAQDPLLLHEHLQSRERGDSIFQIAVSDGRLEAHLQDLGSEGTDHLAAGALVPSASSYALRDSLFETSLKPEVFAASGEDRRMAIDQATSALAASGDGNAIPPNLIGGILVVFGIFLTAAAVFDLLVLG